MNPRAEDVPRMVPTLLSVVAGFVDSCTFLALFGLFVAQVTGSFVVAGAQLATHDPDILVKVLALPAFFLAAVITTIVAARVGRGGRSPLATMLALECALLVGFLLVALVAPWAGARFDGANAPAALAASLFGLSAMGVQSAMVRLLMRGAPSTNVMTTNMTQLAIDVAEWGMAWQGRRSAPADTAAAAELAAASDKCAALLPIVLGFLFGTVAGALAYLTAGVACLAVAIAIVFGLMIWAMRR
jgi:uncharacterized membrane protein YoaK (UPF0700 family)